MKKVEYAISVISILAVFVLMFIAFTENDKDEAFAWFGVGVLSLVRLIENNK